MAVEHLDAALRVRRLLEIDEGVPDVPVGRVVDGEVQEVVHPVEAEVVQLVHQEGTVVPVWHVPHHERGHVLLPRALRPRLEVETPRHLDVPQPHAAGEGPSLPVFVAAALDVAVALRALVAPPGRFLVGGRRPGPRLPREPAVALGEGSIRGAHLAPGAILREPDVVGHHHSLVCEALSADALLQGQRPVPIQVASALSFHALHAP
mmetsp:Transcript_5555/g.16410  ORF Transcript_5555/g.16410 Transcript_5555/m.16410 type:complete len:207 (+) Transcript_5555:374-994(+)